MMVPQPVRVHGAPARVGVVWRPDFPPGALAEFACAAEHAGVDELWLWEDCFLQGGIAQAAVALAQTRSLVVGIGVLPAPLRGVVATALEISTLATMFPGRVQLAIGHGVQRWMRQAGAAVPSPLTLLREYVTALRGLLAGHTISMSGHYVQLDAVRLQFVPDDAVPVLIGGAGPKTLALAGGIADGVLLDCQHTASSAGTALGVADRARSATDIPDFRRVMYIACAPGPFAAERLTAEAQRWNVTPAQDFGVGGSATDISAAVEPYCAAGLDTIVLQPIGEETGTPDLLATAAALVRAWRHPSSHLPG
ncbi:LLM class flavin-dependent oxidoreductase [Mycolicibacterium cosmeticum]|uniref:LLM class flavin-dependent oxidoreductase n=1 Tax=Mycolicibacterium cosmeticum TaxID=258533 RepID=UPI003204E5DF